MKVWSSIIVWRIWYNPIWFTSNLQWDTYSPEPHFSNSPIGLRWDAPLRPPHAEYLQRCTNTSCGARMAAITRCVESYFSSLWKCFNVTNTTALLIARLKDWNSKSKLNRINRISLFNVSWELDVPSLGHNIAFAIKSWSPKLGVNRKIGQIMMLLSSSPALIPSL
jgi:hypothetical protein